MIKHILIKHITPEGSSIVQFQCCCCHSNNVNNWVKVLEGNNRLFYVNRWQYDRYLLSKYFLSLFSVYNRYCSYTFNYSKKF